MNDNALVDLAIKGFYHKPLHALFRALELSAYRRSDIRLTGAMLDLGCGDGRVARALVESGMVQPRLLVGLDFQSAPLQAASALGVHRRLVRGDGRMLPFADESFDGVFANGMLCALPDGLATCLAEIGRVLRPGGSFVATVPMSAFGEGLRIPRLLGRFSNHAGRQWRERFDERLEHRIVLGDAAWTEAFEQAGLHVVGTSDFIGLRALHKWEILSLAPFRVAGLLRRFPVRSPALARRFLRDMIIAEQGSDFVGDQFGYRLIHAVRPA